MANKVQMGKAYVVIGAVNKTRKAFANIGAEVEKLGKKMAGIGLAVETGFGLSFRKFAQFEDKMKRLEAVMDLGGKTGPEELRKSMARLGEEALKLGGKTSFTAVEVADAMRQLGQAGLDTESILASIGPALDVAKISGMEMAQVAEVMNDVKNSYRLSTEDFQRVADVLARTASGANFDLEKLGDSMQYVAGTSGAADQSVEDIAAGLAIMADRGLKASKAGTSLNAFFTKIKSADVQDKLKEMFDIDVADAEGNFRSYIDIMADLEKATRDMNNVQKQTTLSGLFDVRGERSVLPILQNIEALKLFRDELKNSAGASERASRIIEDSSMGAIFRLTSAFEGLQISIGKALEPVFRPMLENLAEMTGRISEYVKNNPDFIRGIERAARAMVYLGTALVGVGVAIKTFSFLISPGGILFGLGAAILVMTGYVDDLGDKFKDAFGDIQIGATTVGALFDRIMIDVGALMGSLGRIGGQLWDSLKAIWPRLQMIAFSIFDLIGARLQQIFFQVTIEIGAFMTKVFHDVVGTLIEEIGNAIRIAGEKTGNALVETAGTRIITAGMKTKLHGNEMKERTRTTGAAFMRARDRDVMKAAMNVWASTGMLNNQVDTELGNIGKSMQTEFGSAGEAIGGFTDKVETLGSDLFNMVFPKKEEGAAGGGGTGGGVVEDWINSSGGGDLNDVILGKKTPGEKSQEEDGFSRIGSMIEGWFGKLGDFSAPRAPEIETRAGWNLREAAGTAIAQPEMKQTVDELKKSNKHLKMMADLLKAGGFWNGAQYG